MGGGSSDSGMHLVYKMYAPYLEAAHERFLDSVVSARITALTANPYDGYVALDADVAYIGVGVGISSYGNLYASFGKYLSGFDVEALWSKLFWLLLGHEDTDNVAKAEIDLYDDEDLKTSIAKCKLEMRKIGAVNSSSYVIAQANNEVARTRKLHDLASEAKFNLLDFANNTFATGLNYNAETVKQYARILKDYFEATILAVEAKYRMAAKKALWPFQALDYERAAIAAMTRNQVQVKTTQERKRSVLSKVLLVTSNVVTGAMVGASIGGWYGAAVGAVVGLVVGLAQIFLE